MRTPKNIDISNVMDVAHTPMASAIAAFRSGRSLNSAAIEFGVDRHTMRSAMARGSDQKLPCGRPLLLSESMETAIDAIFASHARSDWPLPASDLPIIAREIAASFGIQRFKACSDWCASFMKRHPSLSIRVPRCLSYLCYGSVTPEAAYHWLKVVSRAYLRVFYTNPPDPSRIFNMDESPMNPAASGQRYVVLKGVAVTKRSSSYREFFTCVVCVSAAGQLAPTLVIMKGKIAQGHWLQEKDARHVVIQAAANVQR